MKKKALVLLGGYLALVAAISAGIGQLLPVLGVTVFLLLGGGVLLIVFLLRHRVHGHFFDSAGVRIHYTDEGGGEPVILVHGLAVNADINWRYPGIIRRLRREYRVIAVDMRGHGLSDRPKEPSAYGVEPVEDIVRLMDHLGLDRAHVVGYSMGGFITLKLLMQHPQRLLSATIGGAGWYQLDTPKMAVLADLRESLDRGQGFLPLIRALEPTPNPSAIKVWLINAAIELISDMEAMRGLVGSMPELVVTEEELRANMVPALVAVGSADPLRDAVDNLNGIISNARVLYIEGADHATTMFRQEFRESILGLIRGRMRMANS